MKILHVTNFFPPAWKAGGVANAVYQIAEEQLKIADQVGVATTTGFMEGKVDNATTHFNGDLYLFEPISNFATEKALFPVPRPVHTYQLLSDQIPEYDIVHLHEHRTPLALIVSAIARKYNVPYVLQEHGSLSTDRGKTRFKQLFDVFVGGGIIKNAELHIATSEAEKKEFVTFGIDSTKITTHPIGIRVSDLNYENIPDGEFRDRFDIAADSLLVMYLGRLNRLKNIGLLMRAFGQTVSDYPTATLAIVGPDYGVKSELEQLARDLSIQDSVVFTGPLYEEDKYSAFKDADIFSLPTTFESFGTTILEAGLMRTAVQVSSACWIGSDLEEKNAVVMNNLTVEDYSDGLHSLMASERLRNRLKKNLHHYIHKNYNWSVITKNIFDDYRSVIN